MIWVTVLGAGTFFFEGLCLHFIGKDWFTPVFVLIGLFFLAREAFLKRRKPERVAQVGKLTPADAVTVCSTALAFFPIIFHPDSSSGPVVKTILLMAFFPLMVFGLGRGRRKKEEETRKEEERLREPLVLRNQVVRSARKAFIVCSHAREVDLHFEVDDRMFLYSLPDGRFLVLFRKDVPLDAFLGSLADFRAEVDDDEDAIGCYGLPHDGPRPDLPLVFVCNKEGESRPFEFNPSKVPISSAVPV